MAPFLLMEPSSGGFVFTAVHLCSEPRDSSVFMRPRFGLPTPGRRPAIHPSLPPPATIPSAVNRRLPEQETIELYSNITPCGGTME